MASVFLSFLNAERVFVRESYLKVESLPVCFHVTCRMGSAGACGESELFVTLKGSAVLPATPKSLHCGMLELKGLLALLSAVLTWDLQENDDQTRNGQRRQRVSECLFTILKFN